jgi:hypothetical protein
MECQQTLMATFKIPSQLPSARDYKVFGYCPDSGDPRVTVVQITGNRAVLWKSINTLNLDIISSVLKCFIGPLLMILAGWIIRRVSKTNFQI